MLAEVTVSPVLSGLIRFLWVLWGGLIMYAAIPFGFWMLSTSFSQSVWLNYNPNMLLWFYSCSIYVMYFFVAATAILSPNRSPTKPRFWLKKRVLSLVGLYVWIGHTIGPFSGMAHIVTLGVGALFLATAFLKLVLKSLFTLVPPKQE
eukprot:Phypoly_transcript_18446.p1 GENE.Phypoly_transcript_18446~~Phypoly_transcript_18446.p1  ORF type:complete len:148 (+),score=1.63 Phypoly_transcript_18446:304-747(+)